MNNTEIFDNTMNDTSTITVNDSFTDDAPHNFAEVAAEDYERQLSDDVMNDDIEDTELRAAQDNSNSLSDESSQTDSVNVEVKTEAPKTLNQITNDDFIAWATAEAASHGLAMKDQKGYLQVFNPTNGHKMYFSKHGRKMVIDTTLPKSAVDGHYFDLSKPNGRISCHILPDFENAGFALKLLATYSERIPAVKSGRKSTAAVSAK